MSNQPKIPARQRPGVGTAAFTALVIAIAGWFVAPWEGESKPVYADIVGVATVCYGHTGKDVKLGQPARTHEECQRLLQGDLRTAYAAVQRCITVPVPPEVAAMFLSVAFNAGPSAVCGSTLQRKANAGDLRGACGELLRWVYAGGKRVQGLVNRRQAEYRVCMAGLGLPTTLPGAKASSAIQPAPVPDTGMGWLWFCIAVLLWLRLVSIERGKP